MMPAEGMCWVGKQVSQLIDLFFPPSCLVCHASFSQTSTHSICCSCLSQICPLSDASCSCCALPFSSSAGSSHLCADCIRQPPPYTKVYAAGLYAGTLKLALQQFKYSGVISLDRFLADLLQAQLPDLSGEEILVPVPLHPRRLRQRCYNQSLLLAKALAYYLQIPLEKTMLARTIDSHSQQGLDARQRALNLRGAFACTRKLSGETVLLIDDVMTTGATLASCSQTLLNAGARKVVVGVVARAPRH